MKTEILGQSTALKEMLNLIDRVAPTKTNVLITGESGTGKELVAKRIHEKSGQKDKAFVAVNCGAIPENLIESELFGHKKGSFTGAISDKQGLFEVANQGVIFLDEIGELPLGMQVKLLRVIQDRTIRSVGDTQDKTVDVRIIAATNRDLVKEVQEGRFREDLYYRLNVILIKTPPLREREGDIELLADLFLKRFSDKTGKNLSFSDETKQMILNYAWPGNVRELENVIERTVALESSEEISSEVLPESIRNFKFSLDPAKKSSSTQSIKKDIIVPAPDFDKGEVSLEEILGRIEKAYLLSALEHAGGVKKQAAKLLGITFRSIRYRLKKLGVKD